MKRFAAAIFNVNVLRALEVADESFELPVTLPDALPPRRRLRARAPPPRPRRAF